MELEEKKDLLEDVKSEVVLLTDNTFHVRYYSDMSGTHIEVSIEDSDDVAKNISNKFSHRKDIRRLVIRKCPPGYIEEFLGTVKDKDAINE